MVNWPSLRDSKVDVSNTSPSLELSFRVSFSHRCSATVALETKPVICMIQSCGMFLKIST